MNVNILSRSLDRLGYAVTTATGGREALDRIAASPPDVVLLDILLPDLSGLEVLRQLRSDPETADLPVILVSGLDQTQIIVEGLELGASDYVTKPLNLPILQARLATQASLKRARDELKRTAQRLTTELEARSHELEVAAHVQRSLLPKPLPRCSQLATAWCYEPATEVGGDLFDLSPLPDGQMVLFLADAMGHGVQAALVAATVKATLAAHLRDPVDLPWLMTRLDQAINALFDDRFVTAVAGLVDPEARRFRYAVAGHPPILVASDSGVSVLKTSGLPLGMRLEHTFEEGEMFLDPGATILFYSDGVTELESPQGEQFGLSGLIDTLASCYGETPESLVSTLRSTLNAHRAGLPAADDLTILAARLL